MRWGLGDFWIATGIFLLVGVVLGAIVIFDNRDSLMDSQGVTISAAWITALIAIPPLLQVAYVVLAVRRKGRGIFSDLAARFKPVDLAVGMLLFLVGITLATLVALAMESLFGISPTAAVVDLIQDGDGTTPGISGWTVLLAVLVALFIPVIEEIVYRGLLWSALEKRGMGETAVLIASSLIFAAIHLEPARFPILFVLGVALGFGRIRTGRLGPCITAHVCLNSVGMIALLATL
ncbi:MAG: type II CAAX endopeptidase family protein [Acidimicrobiaceae bacterium]|nr:type II CAAX endopeptidase family protein [Acidimicrobiaceae bacterium]MDE0605802.1 type II CAAX endopeptidase family protein [Acidimicrobiaceae bacterium]